jgi:hypothetical protein
VSATNNLARNRNNLQLYTSVAGTTLFIIIACNRAIRADTLHQQAVLINAT